MSGDRLSEARKVFSGWLHLDDFAPVLAVAATIVANLADGDPVWLLIVGPASGGKTEILSSCSALPYVLPAATITEAALLSGTAKKDRDAHATGGLLRSIGNFGILLAKDFTSVLAQNKDTASRALAAMREIYDGSWDRPMGVDGGKVLHWDGKCGFVGGVTPSYDRYAGVVTALGDRFMLLRLPDVDAEAQGMSALDNGDREKLMRTELSQAMCTLIESADRDRVHAPLSDDDRTRLVRLATFAAKSRTAVERDGYSGELLAMPQAEGPARLVKCMRRMLGALAALGVDHDARWDVLHRIAFDCAPAIRLPLMRTLVERSAAADALSTSQIASLSGLVGKTTLRQLEDLALLGLVDKSRPGSAENSPYLWCASDWLRDFWPPKVRQRNTTYRVVGIKEGAAPSKGSGTSLSHSCPPNDPAEEPADHRPVCAVDGCARPARRSCLTCAEHMRAEMDCRAAS